MFGLDAAGKTSIINYLKNKFGYKTYESGFVPFPYTNLTFNEFNYKDLNLSVIEIDIGGWSSVNRGKMENKLSQIFKDAKGIICVIDSCYFDHEEDFFRDSDFILSHKYLKNLPVLILSNKQDFDKALSPEEIIKKIEIEKYKEKNWLAVGTSIITGEGIEKGFDWMISILKN